MAKLQPNDELGPVSDALKSLLASLPINFDVSSNTVSNNRLRSLREEIAYAIAQLTAFSKRLDPIIQPEVIFDPTDPDTIGRFIAETLLAQIKHPLGTLPSFYGSGVYALYYKGSFAAYAPISGKDHPLYIGKADPADHDAITPEQQGDRLWSRLFRDHAKSIRAVGNLDVSDFECRYLVVKSRWQTSAESYLISKFKPVWNTQTKICFGISKHGDSPGTRSNTRSPWDTLHPGRPWAWSAGNKDNPLTADEISQRVLDHFSSQGIK